MEKDDRLSQDFINDVYYDVDLKKAQNAGITNNANKAPEKKETSEKVPEVNKPSTPKTTEKADKIGNVQIDFHFVQ